MATNVIQLNTTPIIKCEKLKKTFDDTFVKTPYNLSILNKLDEDELHLLLYMQKRVVNFSYSNKYNGEPNCNKCFEITQKKIENFEKQLGITHKITQIRTLEKYDFIRGYFLCSIESKRMFLATYFIINPYFFAHGNVHLNRQPQAQNKYDERRRASKIEYRELSKLNLEERLPYQEIYQEQENERLKKEEEEARRYADERKYIYNELPYNMTLWHKKLLPEFLYIIKFMDRNNIDFDDREAREHFLFLAINMFHGGNDASSEHRTVYREIKSYFTMTEIQHQISTFNKAYSYSKRSLTEYFKPLFTEYPELEEHTPNILPVKLKTKKKEIS